MPFRRSLPLLLIISFFSGSCGVLPGGSVPTRIPEEHLPTLIELTAQAGIDQVKTAQPATETIDPADYTPTPTPTRTPTPEPLSSYTPTLDIVLGTAEPVKLPNPLPPGEIQIISPGRLSRVISPFKLHVYLAPPRSDRDELPSYRISIYGDGGTLLARETPEIENSGTGISHLVMDIPFQIRGEAATARLEISAADPYGRVSALASTDVILLSSGDPEIKSVQDLYANLIVQQPIPSTLIQGDLLIVQGVTRFAPNDQLLVELVNRDGNQVGSALIDVNDLDLGNGYRSFSGEIPFQVNSSSWIRVQVIARDGQFSGIKQLSSVEVLVSP